MSSFIPPSYNSDVFNTGLFINPSDGLSIDEADQRYLRYGSAGNLSSLSTGAIDSDSYLLAGTPINFNYITGIIAGSAEASKALVLNSERDISGIRNMYANSMTCAGGLAAPELTFDSMNFNGLLIDGVATGSAQNKLMMIDNDRKFGPLTFNADNTLNLSNNLFMFGTPSAPFLKIGRAITAKNSVEIGYTHTSDGSDTNRLYIMHHGATAANTITFTANGRVGIGSPTATQKLEINGNVNISSGSFYMGGGFNLMKNVDGNINGVRLADAAGLGSEFYTSNTLRYGGFAGVSLGITNAIWTAYGINETPFIALSDDFITMGAAMDSDTSIRFLDEDSPTTGYKLSASGVISTFSDERLKTDITPLKWDNILEKICSMEPVSYRVKRPDNCERETSKFERVNYGFISQNIQPLFPEFVFEEQEYLWLEYGRLWFPLVQGIQELTKLCNEQQEQIQELKTQMELLCSRPVVQKWIAKQK